jgi:AcrR family transcriptional regulator
MFNKQELDDQKRTQLIEKSLPTFLSKTVEQIKINELCKELDVSKRTFYKYISSKIELYLMIDQKLLREFFIPNLSNIPATGDGYTYFKDIVTKFKDLAFQNGIDDQSIKDIEGLSHFTILSGLHGIFFYMFTDPELTNEQLLKYKTQADCYLKTMLSAIKN